METRIRATLALTIAAMAATFVVGPTAAAGTVRWVDDDGHAGGPAGCDGTKSARVFISAAVAAAAPGDTINVCPGVYAGALHVDTPSLTIRSVKPHKAVIAPPIIVAGAQPAGVVSLVLIGASGVHLRGFKISLASTATCVDQDAVVAGGTPTARLTDVAVTGNLIVGRSDASSMSCGLATGVMFVYTRGVVSGNTVRNWNGSGAIEATESRSVDVLHNTLRWSHLDPAPTFRAAAAPAGAPSYPGVVLSRSHGHVVGNQITLTDGAYNPGGSGGIVLDSTRATVKANTVSGFDYGITAGYAGSGSILDNTVRTGADIGMFLYSYGLSPAPSPVFTVRGNTVHGFVGGGIRLSTAPDTLIEDNDFSHNPGTDCSDASDPTQSTWHRNKGGESQPAGLCRPGAKPHLP